MHTSGFGSFGLSGRFPGLPVTSFRAVGFLGLPCGPPVTRRLSMPNLTRDCPKCSTPSIFPKKNSGLLDFQGFGVHRFRRFRLQKIKVGLTS